MYKNMSRYLQLRARRSSEFGHPHPTIRPTKIPEYIKSAFRSKEIISGTVEQEIKGGYIIDLGGFKAFCPHSEMYPHNYKIVRPIKSAHKLNIFDFIIKELNNRSVIVSSKKVAEIAFRITTWAMILVVIWLMLQWVLAFV